MKNRSNKKNHFFAEEEVKSEMFLKDHSRT